MQDIGYMFAVHTQQLMSRDVYVKTSGQWEEVLRAEYGDASRLKVGMFDVLVDYDLVIKDGSVNAGEYADSWIEVWRSLSQQPMLFQNLDVVRIFKHIARIMGAKDINEFVLKNGQVPNVQTTVDSTQNIQGQVGKGNMVPLNQM
jgi:hypothetical protein